MTTKDYNKEYYEKNKDKEKQRSLKYYYDNKEKIDREKRKEYLKEYYKNNKKPLTDKQKEERNKNRREKYANDKEYREKTKNKVREYNKRNPNSKRNSRLFSGYGITSNEFDEMLNNQSGGCAICGAKRTGVKCGNKKEQSLFVDHDHVGRHAARKRVLNWNLIFGRNLSASELGVPENSITG